MAGLYLGIQQFGFEIFTLNVDIRNSYEANANPVLTTHPDSFHLEYDGLKLYEMDPVLLRGLSADRPFEWSSAIDHANAAASDVLIEIFREMPVVHGLVVPLPASEGRRSLINVATSRDIQINEPLTHSISIIASTAVIKARELGIVTTGDASARLVDAQLSTRQIEILQWAAKGKSNNDIATIMKLTKRAVDWHMSEILFKLKVSSRSQAVAFLHTADPVSG